MDQYNPNLGVKPDTCTVWAYPGIYITGYAQRIFLYFFRLLGVNPLSANPTKRTNTVFADELFVYI